MLGPRLLIVPMAMLLCGFTDLQHFEDAPTGLIVDPPNSFIISPVGLPADATTAKVTVLVIPYDTADPTNPPTPLCIIALHERNDVAGLSQQALNERMRDPGQIAKTIEVFESSYVVTDERAVELGGVAGHQFTMDEVGDGGDLDDLVQVASMFDTPAGRVSFTCMTSREMLSTDSVSFDLIRDGVTLP